MNSFIDSLNRRLGESLGLVCGGALPRFAWKFAPDEPFFVYDTDNRTLLKRCWADSPAPGGGVIGKVWLLAEWRINKTFDHFGYGEGLRVPHVFEKGYSPYIETALAPGEEPTAELTANYIRAIDYQLQNSAAIMGAEESMANYLAEEKYTADRNRSQFANEHLEASRKVYDDHCGAVGNLSPGARGGFLSFQNNESLP